MPIAQKEFVLNYAMNRWQLNFKRNVGPTSKKIRICNPSSVEEWSRYYYENVRSRAAITELGKALFKHISVDIPGEIRFHPDLVNSITEQDCINYMHNIVINRTFNGFAKERGLQ